MIRQRKHQWILFLSVLMAGIGAFWMLSWDSDENLVYESILREEFDGSGVSYYVILDITRPMTRFGVSSFHAKELGLSRSTRIDYSIKNLFNFHIRPNFDLPHPFTTISESDLEAVYKLGQNETMEVKKLKSLLGRSWGVITLSRAGFDISHRHAVVYTQLTYCGLCGGGRYVYLSKETGVWRVVGCSWTWVS